MYENFVNTLNAIVDLPAEEEDKILNIVKRRTIHRGECFIRAREVPYKFAYNLDGLFRYYYVDTKGNEFTKGFFPENTFISSYSAMIQNRGSYFTIEALEDASVLIINYCKWF